MKTGASQRSIQRISSCLVTTIYRPPHEDRERQMVTEHDVSSPAVSVVTARIKPTIKALYIGSVILISRLKALTDQTDRLKVG